MRYEPKELAYSVVLIGSFNPKILSPAWLRMNDLVDDEEYESGEIEIIHPDIARFTVGDIKIEVNKRRFICSIAGDPAARLIDFMSLLFKYKLPHVPVVAIGINYENHFPLDCLERRIALGRALSPLSPWGEMGERIAEQPIDNPGGLYQLTMREPIQKSEPMIRRDVAIEASRKFPDDVTVFMRVNYHIQLTEPADDDEEPPAVGALEAMAKLEEHFEDALLMSKAIVSEMMEYSAELSIQPSSYRTKK